MTLEQLCNAKGVGEKTAQKLLAAAQEVLAPKAPADAADAGAAKPPPAEQAVDSPVSAEPHDEEAPPQPTEEADEPSGGAAADEVPPPGTEELPPPSGDAGGEH
jgi:hypothetical protein